MTRLLKITVFGLLVSMGITSVSHAQFEVNGSQEKVKIDSIPFVVALRKIVPVDYDFSFETKEDLGQAVSYEYNDNWTDTLSSLLSGMDLGYKVDGNLIRIYAIAPIAKDVPAVASSPVTQQPKPVAKKITTPVDVDLPAAEVAEEEEYAPYSSPAPVVKKVVEETPVVDNRYVWKVRRGFTLQEIMKSWGEQVGWNVVWDSDRDFDIQSEVSFSGSFVDAASALITAFAEADPPVVGTFYKNKTLVIETTSNGEVN